MARMWIGRCVLALLLGMALPAAQAADTCFVSADPVAFGVYDTTAAVPTEATGQATVDCQGNKFVAVTITLSAGTGSFASRAMTSGAGTLAYNLYLDAARTIVFGDGSGGSASATCTTGITSGYCVGSNPSGAFRRAVLPVYGRIPALQNVPSGSYGDTIQVTVEF